MSVLDFEKTDIPPDSIPGEGQLTCEICGNKFEHSGRGRKPKKCENCRATRTTSGASSRRTTSKDVESALAVLDGTYSTVSLGLAMLNPRAAITWAGQLDTLQAQNRVTLAGDPNLTKSINRLGERTGKAAFFLAHVFALAPVIMAIREDMPKKQAKHKPVEDMPNTIVEESTSDNLRFFG